jgi:hypothetical protein
MSSTAASPAAGDPRAEDSPTTWTNKRTMMNLLQVNPQQLAKLVREGAIRQRRISDLRPQYALEDGLKLRGNA